MTRHKRTKKTYLQFITQYGIHIWAILLIANAVMVYTYQIATHAASKSDTNLHALDVSTTPSQSPSPSVTNPPSPSVPPDQVPLVGPGINLQFSVPGIGSGGGVMKPAHLKRNVTIYLYSQDVNSMNQSVKPLYTIQTTATYDSNQYSPTYTSFINSRIDLGGDVKDGSYQVAFKTDQSLRTIIKQNASDLGGEIFGFNKTIQGPLIPPQTVLMGDTIPNTNGDNTINISDYNAFVSCYGNLNNTNNFCKTGNYGDFNDDGIIDGIDYNILLRSLYALSQQGLAVPHLSPSPSAPTRVTKLIHPVTPTLPAKKIGPTPTPSKDKTSVAGKGGSALGGILFVLFIIVLGVIGFIFRSKIKSLIHLSPTGTPATENTEDANQEAAETEITEEGTEQTEESAEQTETPEGTETEQATTDQPDEEPANETPAPEPQKAGDTLEKDCYIKTKGKDEEGSGMWLLLTDDYGAMNAHYSKTDVKDGFAKVKGVLKIEEGKKFLEISELTMEG